jgi:sulfate adenylyltransferase
VSLLPRDDERADLTVYAKALPSIQLPLRALSDIELLATGALSPLDRFMGRDDYERVMEEMRLANGTLFPIPVTLPVAPGDGIAEGKDIALRGPQNELIGIMTIEEYFERDGAREARLVCGTTDVRHPLVAEMASWPSRAISGPLKVLNLPRHYDFVDLRLGPAQTRRALEATGCRSAVAFQTRSPMHRADEEVTKRAADELGGALLIQVVVGMTSPGDIDHYTRVRACKALVDKHYDPARTVFGLLPLATRMAGPREAVWHAIIARNHGATHLAVAEEHAAPALDSSGQAFYARGAAQELVKKLEGETGIAMVPLSPLVYLPDADRYESTARVRPGARVASLSSTEVMVDYLGHGRRLPEWFTRPEVGSILSRVTQPTYQQGVCIWFTGLSGAGKSTIGEILANFLMEHGRQVTLLDGDVVRTHLSKGLGFSKEDRDVNIRRIGYVASEIVHHHGIVICAAVSPYRATRNECRSMIGTDHFVEVFVDTPIEECERRDIKGMYAKARRGEIKQFTGIDDPYEPPLHAEVRLTTTDCTPDDNARKIIAYLIGRGFLLDPADERNFSMR